MSHLGLDPAGPYFEDTDPRVRLDRNDALFVDVIHTDSPPAAQGNMQITNEELSFDFQVH